jgi:hypothetical protein
MAKKKKEKKLTQILKNRWLPNDTTRPQTFADRKKVQDKKAARGRSWLTDGSE